METYEPSNLATVKIQTRNPNLTQVSQSNAEVCFLRSPRGPHLFVRRVGRSPTLSPRLPAVAGRPVASLRGTPAQQRKRRR